MHHETLKWLRYALVYRGPHGVAQEMIEGIAMSDDQLIDVKGVAKLLNCSSRQVWKLLASGRMPDAVRLGRSVKWRRSDIQRFIDVGCNMRAFG